MSEEDIYIIDKTNEKNIIKYKKGKRIGKGGYAKCYLLTCLNNNKEYVGKLLSKEAIKKPNKELDLLDTDEETKEKIILKGKKNLISEKNIHQELSHKNIVKFHTTFEDDENLYLILEYCKNGDLNNFLDKREHLTEFEAQCYLKQIIQGLKYLHDRNIIHRDLKLENIFLTENMEVKLGDFGLALQLKKDEENIMDKPCGTLKYMAPEIFEGNHSKKSDIWALGIILYELLFGKLFIEIDKKTIKTEIDELKKFYDYNGIRISERAKNLILQMLEFDPKKRPSLDKIITHQFFEPPVPNLMPAFTYEEKLPLSYIKKYWIEADKDGIVNKPLIINNEQENEEEDINNNNIKEEENLIGVQTYIEDYFDFDNYNHCVYLLNNGYYGIFFDKNKNILLNPNNDNIIIYYEENIRKEYKIRRIPFELNFLKNELDCLNSLKSKLKSYENIIKKEENNLDIYLMKFTGENKTKFFWFNNYDMQVFFEENKYNRPVILYSKENKVVTYIKSQKNQEKVNYSIDRIKKKEIINTEFVKKFKLITDTLSTMRQKINGNS